MNKNTFFTVLGMSIALAATAFSAQLSFEVADTLTATSATQLMNNPSIYNSLTPSAQGVIQSIARGTSGAIKLNAEQKAILQQSIATLSAPQIRALKYSFHVVSTVIDTKDVSAPSAKAQGVNGPALSVVTGGLSSEKVSGSAARTDSKYGTSKSDKNMAVAIKAKNTPKNNVDNSASFSENNQAITAQVADSLRNIDTMKQQGKLSEATAADLKVSIAEDGTKVGLCTKSGEWTQNEVEMAAKVNMTQRRLMRKQGLSQRAALIAAFVQVMGLSKEEATIRASRVCSSQCAEATGIACQAA